MSPIQASGSITRRRSDTATCWRSADAAPVFRAGKYVNDSSPSPCPVSAHDWHPGPNQDDTAQPAPHNVVEPGTELRVLGVVETGADPPHRLGILAPAGQGRAQPTARHEPALDRLDGSLGCCSGARLLVDVGERPLHRGDGDTVAAGPLAGGKRRDMDERTPRRSPRNGRGTVTCTCAGHRVGQLVHRQPATRATVWEVLAR